jgi:hypothetical protein
MLCPMDEDRDPNGYLGLGDGPLARALSGRPRLSEDERRRSVSVSLSPDILDQLEIWQREADKNRSEMIEVIVREQQALLSSGFKMGVLGIPAPLTEEQSDRAAQIAAAAISAWASSEDRSPDAIASAIGILYRAAVEAVRTK